MRYGSFQPIPQPALPGFPLISRRTLAAARMSNLLGLGFLLLCLAAPSFAADDTSALGGSWEMDKALSEDPMETMRQQRGGGMQGGGGRGGGMGGGMGGGVGGGLSGGGRGGGRSGGAAGSPEEMHRQMQELRDRVELLEIVQTHGAVTIVFADDSALAFATDNRRNTVQTPMGEAEIKARWRDGALVVKTKTERNTTTETYYVTEDRRLLTVVVEMSGEGPMGSVSYKRFYRPVDPGAALDTGS